MQKVLEHPSLIGRLVCLSAGRCAAQRLLWRSFHHLKIRLIHRIFQQPFVHNMLEVIKLTAPPNSINLTNSILNVWKKHINAHYLPPTNKCKCMPMISLRYKYTTDWAELHLWFPLVFPTYELPK